MRYWIERFHPGIFLPAAAVVAVAAQAGRAVAPSRLALDTALALLLIAQFRLWDDLADRSYDRETHPERLLANTDRIAPFVITIIGLAVINGAAIAWWRGAGQVVALILLNAGVAGWYSCRPVSRTRLTSLAVLLKYPAIVFVLAERSSSPAGLALSLTCTYLAACAYEVWHDRSPFRRGAPAWSTRVNP
jgi:hypothetical protein